MFELVSLYALFPGKIHDMHRIFKTFMEKDRRFLPFLPQNNFLCNPIFPHVWVPLYAENIKVQMSTIDFAMKTEQVIW